jgi:flagellar motor component MotA
LEEDAMATSDEFLQKALMLVVDGTDLQELLVRGGAMRER